MKRTLLLMFFIILFCSEVICQTKKDLFASKKKYAVSQSVPFRLIEKKKTGTKNSYLFSKKFSLNASPNIKDQNLQSGLKVIYNESNTPVFISGSLSTQAKSVSPEYNYLIGIKDLMKINQPEEEFSIISQEMDKQNTLHVRMQQLYKGVKVYGGQVSLHSHEGQTQLMTGRYFPSPTISVVPTLSGIESVNIALQNAQKTTKFRHLTNVQKQFLQYQNPSSELIIYHIDNNPQKTRLAYYIVVRPNFMERYEYIIDAHNGTVIEKLNSTCFIDGPRITNAVDLNGVSQSINTYQVGNTFYLIDASKAMFQSSASTFPGNGVGVIYTYDAANIAYDKITTLNYNTSADNTWNNPTAISAHYNSGFAYNYYKTTHNRNSINGNGGNINALINVSDQDGKGFDNAFWNGQYMAYGNGRSTFKPLAGGLDVGGHEMTHGVVESSANLVYKGQSGAINESFADIFGFFMDRTDYLIGEDVVVKSVFPSGALRSLQDPNQGGSSLNDPGYQPKNMTQYYTGSQDNGGVHINSGIPNYAFYLFITSQGMTAEKGEQVYYKALTQYLTSNSQFSDLRLAIIQAATDLFGVNSTEVTSAGLAFDSVGITAKTDVNIVPPTTPFSLQTNPGNDFILVAPTSSSDLNSVYNYDVSGNSFRALSQNKLNSKPTVTDDGSTGYFVGTDKKIHKITLTGSATNESIIDNQQIWNSVAVSKDGKRLAATTQNQDTSIFVFNLINNQGVKFRLYNPTNTQGVNGSGVLYADAIDWDHTGEFVIYDSYNAISKTSNDSLSYWDIGFINVWNNVKNNFGTGEIEKLFSDLPQNISVGNPVFSKNSPSVIAMDLVNETSGISAVYTYNFETGDAGEIFDETVLGFPSFSKADDKIIFNASNGSSPIIAVNDLQTDKIKPKNSSRAFITGGKWGVWYGQGVRSLNPATITPEISSPFCADVSINVGFITSSTFADGNVFNAQLSDSNGDFVNPVNIGSLTGTGSGTINSHIPASTLLGSGYRIRVVSSKPVAYGFANNINIQINPLPVKPVITQNGFVLTSDVGSGLQWFFEGNPIAGATNSSFVPLKQGSYSVKNSNSCGDTISEAIIMTTVGTEDEISEHILIYPNPASESFNIKFTTPIKAEIQIYNALGKPVSTVFIDRKQEVNIKTSNLTKGLFILEINISGKKIKKKLIIE